MKTIFYWLKRWIVWAALIVFAPWAFASNLTVDGNLTVNDDTTLKGDATVEGDVTLEGDLDVRADGSHTHVGSLRIGTPEENGHDGMVNLVRQPIATEAGAWFQHSRPGQPAVEVVSNLTGANPPPSGRVFRTRGTWTVEDPIIGGNWGGVTLVVSGYLTAGGIAGGGTNIAEIRFGVITWTESGSGVFSYTSIFPTTNNSYIHVDGEEFQLPGGAVSLRPTLRIVFKPGVTGDALNESAAFGDLFIGDTRTIGQAGTYSLGTDEYDGRKLKLEYTTPSRQVRNDFVMSTIGHLGLGTNDPTERLTVNGKIKTKEVIVTATGWPDFVFEEDYPQPSLEEWEEHIEEKGHLPGIPSRDEVDETGVGLAEMQRLLLQKIEELTLIMLEQDRRLEEQERTIAHLLEANEPFRAEIEAIK